MNFPLRKSYGVALGLALMSQANAFKINFDFDSGVPQKAKNAAYLAAKNWESRFRDPVSINVRMTGLALDPNSDVVAYADSSYAIALYTEVVSALEGDATSALDRQAVNTLLANPFGGALSLINRVPDSPFATPGDPLPGDPFLSYFPIIAMTLPNARALGLWDAVDTSIDANFVFNTNFDFDYTPGNGIRPGSLDFTGVLTHEIGHSLGFVSTADDIDFLAVDDPTINPYGHFPSTDFFPDTLDLFRYSELSTVVGQGFLGFGFTDITADDRDKYFSVDGGTTGIAEFSTGTFFGDGAQASHWKSKFPPGDKIGIMDPYVYLNFREKVKEPDVMLFDAIGWDRTSIPDTGYSLGLMSFLMGVLFWKRGQQK